MNVNLPPIDPRSTLVSSARAASNYEVLTPSKKRSKPKVNWSAYTTGVLDLPKIGWSSGKTSHELPTDLMRPEKSQGDPTTIEDLFAFRDVEKVSAFLSDLPDLRALLTEARSAIRSYFPKSQLFLEVVIDPETDHKQLLLSIASGLDEDIAIDTLLQFREDWWLDNIARANMLLSIDLEFE